jgi:hypothetical protein
VTKTHVAWTLRRAAPLTPSPLIVGDEIYIVNDGGIASCLDARTGKTHWQQRLGGEYSASPVFADGRIYFLNEEGSATAIAPGRSVRQACDRFDRRRHARVNRRRGWIVLRSQRHASVPHRQSVLRPSDASGYFFS